MNEPACSTPISIKIFYVTLHITANVYNVNFEGDKISHVIAILLLIILSNGYFGTENDGEDLLWRPTMTVMLPFALPFAGSPCRKTSYCQYCCLAEWNIILNSRRIKHKRILSCSNNV
jgi:hypothetical protein